MPLQFHLKPASERQRIRDGFDRRRAAQELLVV